MKFTKSQKNEIFNCSAIICGSIYVFLTILSFIVKNNNIICFIRLFFSIATTILYLISCYTGIKYAKSKTFYIINPLIWLVITIITTIDFIF